MKKLLLLTLLVSAIIIRTETEQEVATQIEETQQIEQTEQVETQLIQAEKTAKIKEIKLQLGGWAISQEVIDWICQNYPKGARIVECGSGLGSYALALEEYEVYSIEHNRRWVNKYKHEKLHYIYAPIRRRRRGGWYPVDPIKKGLPEKYDLIIVDGPTGRIGRYGFLKNIELFNSDLTIIFDDIDRPAEKKLFKDTQDYLQREGFVLETDHTVGIIPAK